MSLLDPHAIRRKKFRLVLRGLDPAEVDELLDRVASAIELAASEASTLPADLTPAAIRDSRFTVVWRGYEHDAVRQYLGAIATEAEAALEQMETEAHQDSRIAGPLPFVARRPTTNPVLPVADMAAAIAFYESLGFEVTTWDDTYAWVKHSGWEWCHLRKADLTEASSAGAYFHVADAAAWRAAIAEASEGKVEIGEIGDMPWGKREFAVHDPWGNWLRFGSPTS